MSDDALRIVTYHRVLEPSDAAGRNPALISATPAGFERQMRHISARCRAVSLDEVVAARRGRVRLPPRPVLITFDDATRDFRDVAWPILRRHGLPALVFVPTTYPDHPELGFWWDRVYQAIMLTSRRDAVASVAGRLDLGTSRARRTSLRALQRTLKAIPHDEAMREVDRVCRELGAGEAVAADVLGWSELRQLASEGVAFGAHTRSHPALTQLPIERAREEIERSRDDLARELGITASAFAYPFGDHDERVAGLVGDAGFDLALTCLDGHNPWPGTEPWTLRRTNITRRTSALIFRARLTRWGARVDAWRHRRTKGDSLAAPGSRTGGSYGERPAARVAYVMSRFPKLSETFILNEMAALADEGLAIEVYPLLRERPRVMHPTVEEWVRRAHYSPFVSWRVARAHAHFLTQCPAAYVKVWTEVLAGTWGSLNFFIGALGTLPKAVRFAHDMRLSGVTHVHAHFATHPAVAALVIHRLTGIPFSFTAHGSDLHVDRRMLAAKVDASAFAVTISQFNKEVMVRECGDAARNRIHVIHCGVDPQRFSPALPDRAADPFRLVCVASLEEVKGHAYLLDACRTLRQRGVGFHCDLVGEGPLRRAIELQISRNGLEGFVHLHGGRPQQEVARLLRQAHAAVLASHPTRRGKREGIPVALMEAMASGLAVVATAISGIPELVEPEVTGLLVPSGDAMALADAIERLQRDRPLCERLGQAGRDKVVREFSLRTNAARLRQLFESPEPSAEGTYAAAAPLPAAT